MQQYNTIKVPRYGEYSVVLSDGSRIKLNSESELRYPVVFTGEQREVYLKGEAYGDLQRSKTVYRTRV
ncbi:MAG: FecR domain-containing protein [Butyricimonas paravirosa]